MKRRPGLPVKTGVRAPSFMGVDRDVSATRLVQPDGHILLPIGLCPSPKTCDGSCWYCLQRKANP